MAVSNESISVVQTREEGTTQLFVYYTSKALLSSKTRYPNMVKLALALITTSRKLRPYFQAHNIHVLTNFPLRQVLQKSDASGRLLKWAVKLCEFDIVFKIRVAIKGRALVDFVAEFTNAPEMEEVMESVEPPTRNLFVDGSVGDIGLGIGVVLVNPEGHKLNLVMRFEFKATNNAAEYKALLAGLRLAKEMQVRRLHINSDSQLVVSQVNGSFSAKDKTMASYLKMIFRLKNAHADALSKLTSSRDFELLAIVPIEHLLMPSIEASEWMWATGTPTWMQQIIAYLKDQVLPTDKYEAYKLRRRSTHFLFVDDVLYKGSFYSLLIRCVGGDDATYILKEIHKGVCGNHSRRIALAQKVLRQVYYWPTLKKGANFVIVAINYFTKWVEVEPLAKIMEVNTSKFFWKNTICRFGIFHSIVSDNGRKFNNKKVRNLCEELGIKKHFSTCHHPQANGQVEAVNKTIKHLLKRKLDASKGAWVDELPQVLWAIRITN
ncbi:uncharacterized protein LOC111394008 [Olea europaea var. sylvestris]|uniref:uncharacterized protein LOC111394008 n=1 Tax=Olea europaea var. sylvestris TaxID=158386 RepID=UPI000C1D15F7|nr:uncharacterized protein LOC111394008 [Olea europaea var. sylvestris]